MQSRGGSRAHLARPLTGGDGADPAAPPYPHRPRGPGPPPRSANNLLAGGGTRPPHTAPGRALSFPPGERGARAQPRRGGRCRARSDMLSPRAVSSRNLPPRGGGLERGGSRGEIGGRAGCYQEDELKIGAAEKNSWSLKGQRRPRWRGGGRRPDARTPPSRCGTPRSVWGAALRPGCGVAPSPSRSLSCPLTVAARLWRRAAPGGSREPQLSAHLARRAPAPQRLPGGGFERRVWRVRGKIRVCFPAVFLGGSIPFGFCEWGSGSRWVCSETRSSPVRMWQP